MGQTPTQPIAPGETTSWFVEVTNTGKQFAGDIVVSCYVDAHGQNVVTDPPVRSLFDFERIENLLPGKSMLLHFTLTPRGRALVTVEGEWVVPVGTYKIDCQAGGMARI